MSIAGEAEWLTVVVAQQRSGTTALRLTLDAGTRVRDFGEVFHESRGSNPVNYFNFRQARIRRDPSLSFPAQAHQWRLWSEYIAALRARVSKPYALIDVKYNSWHHFDPVWRLPHQPPALIGYIRRARAGVLHVIRRDVFAQACSAMIAQERGFWHVDEGAQLPPSNGPIEIDPSALETMMTRSRNHARLFRNWFSGYPRYAELSYEDLFADQRLTQRTYRALAELIGVGLDEGNPVPLGKTTGHLGGLVANREQVRRHFCGGPFGTAVDRALAAD